MQQTDETRTQSGLNSREGTWDMSAEEEFEELPREKVIELFRESRTEIRYYANCGERIWLTATPDHANQTSQYHICGEEYNI